MKVVYLTFLYKVPFPATLFCFWLLVLILPTYVNTQWNQEMYWEYMASWGGVAPGVLSEARHERCNTFSMSHVFLIHLEIPIYDLFCLVSIYTGYCVFFNTYTSGCIFFLFFKMEELLNGQCSGENFKKYIQEWMYWIFTSGCIGKYAIARYIIKKIYYQINTFKV